MDTGRDGAVQEVGCIQKDAINLKKKELLIKSKTCLLPSTCSVGRGERRAGRGESSNLLNTPVHVCVYKYIQRERTSEGYSGC